MTFQILMSCMYQNDASILIKSNINCDVLVENQCNERDVKIINALNPRQEMICSQQRGLSKSRNACISQAWADVCLIADDDEVFSDDLEQRVVAAYNRHPNADIIAFQVSNASKFGEGSMSDIRKYPSREFKCGVLNTLHISSWQISFKRQSIISHGILFDEMMGAGTGNGAQEENKFLVDCLKSGMEVWYVPVEIARMEEKHTSVWFNGFDPSFFYKRGWATRRFLGLFLSVAYAFYYVIKKAPFYHKDVSPVSAFSYMLKGIFANVPPQMEAPV